VSVSTAGTAGLGACDSIAWLAMDSVSFASSDFKLRRRYFLRDCLEKICECECGVPGCIHANSKLPILQLKSR
jgi:hypothetical protein